MRGPTDAQNEVLRAMLWNDGACRMTDSEIAERTNKIARFGVARGTVVDRLRSLTKKGLVVVVDDGPPRRRALTALGVAAARAVSGSGEDTGGDTT